MIITLNNNNPNLLKKFNCKDFTVYKKKNGEMLFGIKVKDKRQIHKYIEEKYNSFEKIPTKIPKGFKKVNNTWFSTKYFCGNKKELTKKNAKKIVHKNFRKYFIHDNGTRPFLVYIKGKEVYIYKIRDDVYLDDSFYYLKVKNRAWAYTKLVKHYKVEQIWIGKSPENPMTRYSGGFGPKFDGNSILLQISKNKYVWIGRTIHQFTMNDEVEIFYSPVGNNNVPYPVIIGTKNIYFIDICFYVDRKHLPENLTNEQWTDLYTLYYDQLEDYSKAIKPVKIIHDRID